MYEGRLEMVWIYLMCSNFIIFRLTIKHLLSQHIPLLDLYIAAIFLRASDGFTVPFFRDVSSPHTDSRLPLLTSRIQLNTVLCEGSYCPQIADNRRISDGVTPSSHRNHEVRLCL
jgi:hypothetical protein